MNSICKRPTCNRATLGKGYDGLCLHHARATGIAHQLVSWDEVNAEYSRLIAGGWTNQHMEHSGIIFTSTAREIREHRRDRFQKRTLQALKETPTVSPWRRATWPLSRRLKALRAIGFTYARIGKEVNLSRTFLHSIAEQRNQWTSVETDEKIRAYYAAHENDAAVKVSRQTERENYPRPADWDDIDNPAEEAVASLHKEKFEPLLRRKVTPSLQAKTRALVDHYGSITATAKALHSSNRMVGDICSTTGVSILNRLAAKIAYHYKKLEAAA
ncbi:hypothetical protein [Corynebacterium flavescens]|uniref:Uncharacterized protein n=1 Tax=Corynebacterium flavescens TaxID=28028 RepID=A0A1L7CNG2_CORFL|nr:hypothetical protein [Corynebacterium flavescens]APT87392.1 hypothetical protein CFLV_09515 [Corynebacterium flavescens]KAA8720479.1 hypothetical protein F4V60_09275 [Corynebacterium flavescens]GEB97760.1 hypothetical protein CFL01nite_12550 [Corynebacterium flavescens]